MTKPLSEDLRIRLIVAVEAGISRRAAAERFGVAVASAIRWVRAWRATGATCAKPQGGDQRSFRIEAYKDVILASIEARVDITLVELAELLRSEHGASFAPSTIWRFFDRHGITFKKKPRTLASSSDPTSRPGARHGSMASPTSIPRGWSSLMRRPCQPRWPACVAAPHAESAAARRSRMGIGKPSPSPALCACTA
jgi:transposase